MASLENTTAMNKIKSSLILVAAALLCASNLQAYIVTGGPGSICPEPAYKYKMELRQKQSIAIVPTNGFWNGFNMMADAVANSSGWSLLAGAGHSLSGSKWVADAELDYQFNGPVGLVVGYDQLWAPGWAAAKNNGQNTQTELVNGGITLSLQIHPFGFIGSTFLTNIVASPFVAEKLATPKNGNALGNVADAGLTFDFVQLANFELSGRATYENRSGQGYWDGNYGMLSVVLTRQF